MPTYEYRCQDCGEHLEIVQSFRDDALTECSNCGGTLKKVFGNIGVVLKGSGFYKTDNRSGGSRSESTSSTTSDSSASGSSTSSGSSESSKTSKSEPSTKATSGGTSAAS